MTLDEIYSKRNDFYLHMSPMGKLLALAAVAIGIGGLAAGLSMGHETRAWGGLLFNVFFFFSIALGGIAFSGMQEIVGAVWGRPINRLHEALSVFVPVAGIILSLFLIAVSVNFMGAADVYSWIGNDSIQQYFGKNVWLQKDFMVIRNIAAIAIIVGLTTWQLRLKLRRDGAFMEQGASSPLGESTRQTLRYWSAPVLVLYALCYSLLGFDLLMSLSPLWFSTLWGGWLFAIMMQTLMATMLLIMFSLKGSPIGKMINRQQFHDIGKFMHGFTIFFAYLTYAHVLTYWYGNVPEETEYFLHRMHGPWLNIVLFSPLFSFVIPLYVLIFKAAKWTAKVTVPISIMILVAQWFTYMLVVSPEVTGGHELGLPWIEVSQFIGILGLFLLSYFWFGRQFPMVAVGDPLLPEAYGDH